MQGGAGEGLAQCRLPAGGASAGRGVRRAGVGTLHRVGERGARLCGHLDADGGALGLGTARPQLLNRLGKPEKNAGDSSYAPRHLTGRRPATGPSALPAFFPMCWGGAGGEGVPGTFGGSQGSGASSTSRSALPVQPPRVGGSLRTRRGKRGCRLLPSARRGWTDGGTGSRSCPPFPAGPVRGPPSTIHHVPGNAGHRAIGREGHLGQRGTSQRWGKGSLGQDRPRPTPGSQAWPPGLLAGVGAPGAPAFPQVWLVRDTARVRSPRGHPSVTLLCPGTQTAPIEAPLNSPGGSCPPLSRDPLREAVLVPPHHATIPQPRQQ